MRWLCDLLAVFLLAACLPTMAPAGQTAPTGSTATPLGPIQSVAPVPARPVPVAPEPSKPPLPRPPRDEAPPLVDAGGIDGFADLRIAPWWTPPPGPSATLRSVLPRIRRALKSCYEHSLKSNLDAHGQVTVRFTVGTDGRVVTVETKQNPSLDGVARCFRRVLRQVRFPPPDQPVDIGFPVLLVSAASRHP